MSMSKNPRTVRVLQYNVLAQSCAKKDARGFPHVPESVLAEDSRNSLLFSQILSAKADILVLEEVEPGSPLVAGLADGWYEWKMMKHPLKKHGVAIFWNDKWVCSDSDTIIYTDSIQCALTVTLNRACIERKDRMMLLVAGTHLKAGGNPVDSTKRLCQSTQFRQFVRIQQEKAEKKYRPQTSLIICGDLNCKPGDPELRSVKEYFDGMESAYQEEEVNKEKEHFTTFKQRDVVKRCCEDYILYNKTEMKLTGKRTLPRVEEIPHPYLPSESEGSDHLMLWADFEF